MPGFAGAALGAKREELALMVNSRNPIVTVETSEELRFSGLLERVAEELGIPLMCGASLLGWGGSEERLCTTPISQSRR